jgi:predicted acyl esterase
MYNHQFQAGVPYDALWLGTIEGYFELSLVRQLPPGVTLTQEMGTTGDDFGNDMQYFGCGARSSSAFKGDAELTGQYVQWDRDRDFGGVAATAPVPIFAIHGVNDDAARVVMLDWFLRRNGNVRANGKPVADKLWLGQWTHGVGCCPNRRGEQWTQALHAWLDKQLQQRNVQTGPPVEVFLSDGPQDDAVPSGRTEIYTADRFPGSPRMVDFYPAANGALTASNGPPGSVSFAGDPFGNFSPASTGSATFKTAPFTSDVLMTGVPQLTLVASITAPMTYLIANLYEEDERGDRRRLSQFAINPVLRDGLDRVSPVVPFRQYELHPPGWPMAQHIRRGDRLVLRVTTSDPDKFPFFSVDPKVSVYTGRGGTVLSVPVIDDPVLYPDTLPSR